VPRCHQAAGRSSLSPVQPELASLAEICTSVKAWEEGKESGRPHCAHGRCAPSHGNTLRHHNSWHTPDQALKSELPRSSVPRSREAIPEACRCATTSIIRNAQQGERKDTNPYCVATRAFKANNALARTDKRSTRITSLRRRHKQTRLEGPPARAGVRRDSPYICIRPVHLLTLRLGHRCERLPVQPRLAATSSSMRKRQKKRSTINLNKPGSLHGPKVADRAPANRFGQKQATAAYGHLRDAQLRRCDRPRHTLQCHTEVDHLRW
jgi:hypothetical protein